MSGSASKLPPEPTPAEMVPTESTPTRAALWLPVVVSGIAVVVWLAILAWMAYR